MIDKTINLFCLTVFVKCSTINKWGEKMNNILIVVFATLAASFAIAYVSTFNRLTLMNKTFINLSISHQALQDFIKETQNNSKDDNDIHKENFIKFYQILGIGHLLILRMFKLE